jgi:polar amino acid transport system substrate-binding protein
MTASVEIPSRRRSGRGMRAVQATLAALALCVGTASHAAVDEAARALLPDDIKQKGTLVVAMPLDFEPFNYLDEKNEQTGLDVDMIRAIGDKLGLKVDIQRIGFASMIPGVSGGRVDAAMSAMGILPARLQLVSFVRYGHFSNGLVVRKGNPTNVRNDDACGHTIAVEKGTQPLLVWQKKSDECVAAGKAKIELLVFEGKGPQVLAVESGRAEDKANAWLREAARIVRIAPLLVLSSKRDSTLAGAVRGELGRPVASLDAGEQTQWYESPRAIN